MADSSSRLDLRVGGKYRLGKKLGSGSFGALAYAFESVSSSR
jgi:casein kinase I family protein HRR25